MELLENADKYGLSQVEGKKVFINMQPLQLIIGDDTYLINLEDYIKDINTELYKYLIKEYRKGNKLMIRLYKEMKQKGMNLYFEKYNGKDIDLKNLKAEIKNFKNITYNPDNNDKFIACIDIEKSFIHIYEFTSDSENYKAKYIHAKIDIDSNYITHLDYSVNQYSKEQYKKIIDSPNNIPKGNLHKKIWRLDGKIALEDFYKIIFCVYDKNEKYVKELFEIES